MHFKTWRSNSEIYGIPAIALTIGLLVGFIAGKEWQIYQIKQMFVSGVK